MKQELSTQHFILNTKNHLSDDLQFLITCCQTDPSKEDIEFITSYLSLITNHECPDMKCPWGELITAASEHGVLPLVYKTLKKLSESDLPFLNAEILTELKAHYMSISQGNILMSAELLRIMHLFESNNIESLAIKGPVLAQLGYSDITLRQYSDLDILVNEKEVIKAGSVLNEHGYDPSFSIKILENKTCLSSTNDLAFYNRSNGILIELHWRLFREKIGKHLHFSHIYDDKQKVKINGKEISTLSTEMLLVYLCLHGSKHVWERIEWICDIDRLIRSKKNLDWDKAMKIAKEMDTYIPLQLGLLLSHTLFQTPLPKNIIILLHTERIEGLVLKTFDLLNGQLVKNEGYARYNLIHMFQMDLLDTKFKKLKYLFSTYFTISRNDCQSFPLPSSLKFLYLFIKPIRVLGKYIQYGK